MFSHIVSSKNSRLLFLSVIGSSFEFFEFAVYSIFALNISRHLMPTELHSTSILLWYFISYGLFFIGYLARPLGGTVFGLISDRVSRKKSFISTMVLMSLATIMIGVLPDYSTIGIIAPILLLVFRLLQGIALGGELPSSTVLLYEHAKSREKIFIIMWFMALTNLGWLTGYLLDAFLRIFYSNQAMDLYGWRLVFFIGGLLALGTAVLRKKLVDAQAFQHYLKLMHHQSKGLVREILKSYKHSLFAGILIEILHGAMVFLVVVLLKNILMQFYNLTASTGTHIQVLVVIAWMFFGAIAPFLVARINKFLVIPIALFGCCFSIFLILIPELHAYFLIFIIMTAAFLAMIDGFAPYIVTRLFPIHLRATGFGISYNFGVALGGILMALFTAHSIEQNTPYTLALSILSVVMFIYFFFLMAAFASKRFEALKVS